MISIVQKMGSIELPLVQTEDSMIPFDMATLKGLPKEYVKLVETMIEGINYKVGEAYFTIHGKVLKSSETLRRGGPHTDGNYEPLIMSFGQGGGNGWKIGENGPAIDSSLHARQYLTPNGGIIIASNHSSCLSWEGEFRGTPDVGGDCSKIKLSEPSLLTSNEVYYGNNHFIHESMPVSEDVHRVMARITLPESHIYECS